MKEILMVMQGFHLLWAVTFHEFSHAFVADKCGDPTPRSMGRVTLNPLKHIDLFGTIIFPGLAILLGWSFLFGWAKPVLTRPSLYRTRWGMLLVAVAGPLSNIITAAVCIIGYRLLQFYQPSAEGFANVVLLRLFLYSGALLNLVLTFINLLPIPGLDGAKALLELLPRSWGEKVRVIEPYSFFILIVFFQSKFASYIFAAAHVIVYTFMGDLSD